MSASLAPLPGAPRDMGETRALHAHHNKEVESASTSDTHNDGCSHPGPLCRAGSGECGQHSLGNLALGNLALRKFGACPTAAALDGFERIIRGGPDERAEQWGPGDRGNVTGDPGLAVVGSEHLVENPARAAASFSATDPRAPTDGVSANRGRPIASWTGRLTIGRRAEQRCDP